MLRTVEAICADIDSLTARDFDETHASARGIARLTELCDELRSLDNPSQAVPTLFRTMERLDGSWLGTPGPIVHTLEEWLGDYELDLAQSVRRRPTPHSIWMVNRILNTDPPDAETWKKLLKGVLENPVASGEAKEHAKMFIEHQS